VKLDDDRATFGIDRLHLELPSFGCNRDLHAHLRGYITQHLEQVKGIAMDAELFDFLAVSKLDWF